MVNEKMLSSNSKASLWGCTACYNHQQKDRVHLCLLTSKDIERQKTCPLGLMTAFVDAVA